jgi:hypothetical protein
MPHSSFIGEFFPHARLFDSKSCPDFTRGRCHCRLGGGRVGFRVDFSATLVLSGLV